MNTNFEHLQYRLVLPQIVAFFDDKRTRKLIIPAVTVHQIRLRIRVKNAAHFQFRNAFVAIDGIVKHALV